MPEITTQYRIVYDTEGTVTISDLIASLQATEKLLKEVGPLFETLYPNFKVSSVKIRVKQISQESPLQNWLLATLVISLKDDIVEDVNALLEVLGFPTNAELDTLQALLFVYLVIWGMDIAYKKVVAKIQNPIIKKKLDITINELVQLTGRKEEEIRKLLEQAIPPSKIMYLAENVSKFFRPSKKEKNAQIFINDQVIESEAVQNVPSEAELDKASGDQHSEVFYDVDIELHAQDVDKAKTGWAGIVKEVSDNRLKMQVYPPVDLQEIYTKTHIKGDVVAIYNKTVDGEYKPHMLHLIATHDS